MRLTYLCLAIAAFAGFTGLTACGPDQQPATPITVHGPTLLMPPPRGPVDQFGDGKYQVGPDVVPGQYKTAGPPDHNAKCYWARLKDFTGSVQSVIAMQYGNHGPDVAVIEPTDKGFETRDCGVWQRTATKP